MRRRREEKVLGLFPGKQREKQDPSIPLGYAEIYSPGQLSIYSLSLSLSK